MSNPAVALAPRRKIVFLDVDGTIQDGRERIAASTVDAITTARRNGHLVLVCTGRARPQISAAVHALGFDGVISAGGGFAEVGGRQVIARTMTPHAVHRLTNFFVDHDLAFYLQTADDLYPSPGLHALYRRYLSSDDPTAVGGLVDATTPSLHEPEDPSSMRALPAVRPYPADGVAKAIFLGQDQSAFDRVVRGLGAEFSVITGTVPHFGTGNGEVAPRGMNKGTTIRQLLDQLDLVRDDAIAIGDSSNDVEMLRYCGTGIAMGNGSDDAKAAADEVTGTVLDDGIWRAFRKHGLV